jgi:glutaminase-like protein
MPVPVSPQRAAQLFALVNARICCPASAAAPCIPFEYPDNGCWARAHEMCRLMINDGADPEKVWIMGNLMVASQNKPDCQVKWGWHVAPTLQVATPAGVETWVVDPSLFPEAVPQTTWFGVQGDPNAVLTPSSAAIYYYWGSVTDPTYAQTNQDLTTYRNILKLRSAGADGPPPYAACMTSQPGVQWRDMIGSNQTHTWFTWGWGAHWKVLWTVMPLTPCPGGGQLTWDVRIERSSPTECTYWITVTNLTADPVKFEGRYDILAW